MPKLSSLDELRELRKALLSKVDASKPRIVVCGGTACQASGSSDIIRVAKGFIIRNRLLGKISLRVTGCHGFCEMGPFILTEPQNAFYTHVKMDDVPAIIEAALSGAYVEDLLYRDPITGEKYYHRDDIPFFKNQQRTILGMGQKIDPIRIHDYLAHRGYEALDKVLSEHDPKKVVEEVKRSGLRGRGGAGFLTGLKWELLAQQSGSRGKFVVCNSDEGDPGAYMDRSVIEGNPHSIIEGMIIGAVATGATDGIIYIRNEYPIAIKHLTVALRQAREHALLGKNILGTALSFDIRLVKGAGAFVCGEETALIHSVEGRTGEPRQRPPFPIQKGIDGKPTVINNVETWANIPVIIRDGAEAFAKIGVKNNSGTKIFSLVGKIRNTGLVEVPMGIPIKEIVYSIGGGPAGKARIKAVQTGGPSGGCIPADKFDLPIDYDSLAEAGSIMGSGGMIVMDDNTCMVDIAKYFMNFLKDESCGKCFTCRKGTQRMYEILDDITKGAGKPEHLEILKELAEVVKDTTMCGLGQTASNPVLSTLRYFQNEYKRHVVDKKCDAFVCRSLVGAPCQSACPLDTEAWRYVALIEKGEFKKAYQIIRAANPFPSICARVCDRKCEQRCQLGTSGGEPVAIRTLKRFITDRIDPSAYKPAKAAGKRRSMPPVAVIGAGPAGIAAASYLSQSGYKVTLFDAENETGGMLLSCIPTYRLPHDIVRKEIKSLINGSVRVQCGVALGRDISIDDLFERGFKAVFLATGAHRSWRLDLEGEDTEGIYPSMQFLKAFNLKGEELAHGRVGIIGGGNSAVDAARVALRQKRVKSVILLYRRTSQEMPAYAEEVEAAMEEGIKLETLVSPVRIRYVEAAIAEGVRIETFVTPVKIQSKSGRLVSIECIRNKLGEVDASGRRKPVPIAGTEFMLPLDTMIVAIGEGPDSDCLGAMGIDMDKAGRPRVDGETLQTSRDGVFAGGDLVTGPNTVVDAIAAGRKAAAVMDRYLRGEALRTPAAINLPQVYVAPRATGDEEIEDGARVVPPALPPKSRKKNFAEVERSVSAEEAAREARRCLRCDLEFTRRKSDAADSAQARGNAR
ncbi:MAG: FAD-dependent oxidoreductase [Candidatus Sumerlaeota bacterium]|nr:FAD-dependent oxidoreductase [Candidatus Sumerlaeota bacterium]